jgi:phospholipase D1/2
MHVALPSADGAKVATTTQGLAPEATSEASETSRTLLRPGRNVWRAAHADRATMLVDAAAYFGALRQAMLQAKHTIYILGWDVDSRAPLCGPSGCAEDGLPRELGPFLTALTQRNPDLQIRILLWDYSLFFSKEREPMPSYALRWRTPPQIDLCMDDAIPLGSSHHQKIVIIDECIAFSGGLDLTIRRWDNCEHDPANCHRVDPTGKAYRPFHDIQMIVDGEAARILTELARERWKRAAVETLPEVERIPGHDPWPETLAPEFRDVEIGLSRTEPPFSDRNEVREVETLFHDMIAAARHTIYIESQYLTNAAIARRLAAAMQRRSELEALIVTPRSYHAVMERAVMLTGRARFMRILDKAGVADRVLVAAPRVRHRGELVDVSVHSKLMIVDDRYLRVGSANICNRSMGTDTECDVTVACEEDSETRAAIEQARNRLVAEHCGASIAEVEMAIKQAGSLISAVKSLPRRDHALHTIGLDRTRRAAPTTLESIADPARPIDPTQYLADDGTVPLGRSRRRPLLATLAMLGVLLLFLALAATWTMTPLATWTDPALWESWLQSLNGGWAIFAVVAIFVLAGLVVFPVTVLIAATAAVFGAWPGVLYAAAGTMVSALATYAIGRWLGPNGLRQFFGPRTNVLTRSFARRGIPAVTLVRIVPVAPFSLVNLAAGAFRIPLPDYLIGTAIGLAPGLGLMSLLGDNLIDMIREPTLSGIAIVVAVLAVAIGLSIGVQRVISRRRGPRRRHIRGSSSEAAR